MASFDSAKSLAIILFTDIFCGFSQPGGWTVLLEMGFEPPRFAQAGEFCAPVQSPTFPVILATISFKYWDLRYPHRVSPSSVATLRTHENGRWLKGAIQPSQPSA